MILLRKFEKDDLDFIVKNFSYYFKEETREFIASTLDEWISSGGDKIRFARCIMLDNTPIGIISISEKERGVAGFGIAILEQYRNRGYATMAFNLAKEEVKKLGITMIKSSCAYDNEASAKLHEKLGFYLAKIETNQAGNKMKRFELRL